MASKTKTKNAGLVSLALARISIGFVFLWAFFDKLFGLGFATCRSATTGVVSKGCAQAWINGGSPTKGFLTHATKGPLAGFYQNLAGHGWVDWLFMVGLLGIGIALIFGIGMKIASITGALLLLMMWSAALWPDNNPVLDDHIVYIFVLLALMYTNSEQKLGLRSWWLKQGFVKKYPILE